MTEQGKIFFLRSGGRVFGPFSPAELQEMRRVGRIDGSAQISCDKLSWKPISEERLSVQHPEVPAAFFLPRVPLPLYGASVPGRRGAIRCLGNVLQLMWNAPAAERKLARGCPPEFWDLAFPFALLCSFFLFQTAVVSTAFFEGNIGHRMLAALCAQLLWSIAAFAELLLLRNAGSPQGNLPAGRFFMLYSMGSSAVCGILLLVRTMWCIAGAGGSGWNGWAAAAFSGAGLLLGLCGAVNLVCGMRETLIREFRIKPAPALYWSAFFLLQSSFLFFGSLL